MKTTIVLRQGLIMSVVFFLVMVIVSGGRADGQVAQRDSKPDPDAVKFFESIVRPILVTRCYECHGPESEHEAGLRVDSLAGLVGGGDSGAAIVPGKPKESLLIDAVNHGEIYQMPPDSKLPKDEISALTRWVRMGAPWPNSALSIREPHGGKQEYQYTDEEKSFWAFQRPSMPPIPAAGDAAWVQSPVDRFVLSKLEASGLKPAAPADKRTWIRRATYDLHGLPPSPKEVDLFLADESSEAFARVVDRLLTSPRYGERWGRHWLDVARYADSNGGDQNRIQANVYRYRDYVVAAFNDDLPYDRFVTEQLAGDLLPFENRADRNRLRTATAFLVLGPKTLIKNDNALAEMDVVDEQIQAVTGAFMGLTIGCCRCHDHKFDPFPMTDYYALAGIFKSTRVIQNYDLRIHRSWNEFALGSDEAEQRHQMLKARHDRFNDLRRLSNKGDGYKEYQKKADAVRETLAKIPVSVAAREGDIADCAIHYRGNPQTLGDPVPRRFPVILASAQQKKMTDRHSGRLELASWLTSGDHPLTSRVMVNRIWRWHFGEGIVRSTDNFGRLGERPDNQPLLDWLALRFVREGWSVKAMHRLIMLSATYRMSARDNEQARAADPENRLHWRFEPRRLEAEEIRDAMLFVSGQLDETMGGPSLPPGLNFKLARQNKDLRKRIATASRNTRRSLYLPVIRSGLFDMFNVFDFANPAMVRGSRVTTTVAPQALFMMNSDIMWEASDAAARRFMRLSPRDEQRVRHLYESACGRTPTAAEAQRLLRFLAAYKDQTANDESDPAAREHSSWQAVCRVMFSSSEFVYVQ